MNLQEIRVSGLLEQYVIGALKAKEEAIVLQTLSDFPQLKKDLDQITEVLRAYNKLELKTTPNELKSLTVDAFKNAEVITTPRRGYSKPKNTKDQNPENADMTIPWVVIWGGLSAILAIALGTLYFMSHAKTVSLNDQIAQLEETIQSKDLQIETLTSVNDSLSELSDSNNIWSTLKPSLRYRDAEMYLISNPITKENYGKINNLPILPTGRSYKIWIQSANGAFTELPNNIESLKKNFMNRINIPIDASRLVISVHRDGTSLTPTARTIIGTIEL